MITEDHLCLLFNICEQCQEKVMSGQSHDLAAFPHWRTLQTLPEKKRYLYRESSFPLWNSISGITDVSKTLSHESKR